MEYRVEQLAAAAGVRVDTVRFYQGRGLIRGPRRRGRVAIYDDEHLARIRRIRALLEQGFSLAQIQRVTEGVGETGRSGAKAGSEARERSDEALLRALTEERVGDRSYTRAELAAEVGVPEEIVAAVQSSGLVAPVLVSGEERFTAADLEMARAGLVIMGAGFPLDELMNLAVTHNSHIQELCEAAIDLFDDHVRKAEAATAESQAITEAFRGLLPQVTRLVALHFQRTLVNRALERLRTAEGGEALEAALAAIESLQLEVSWR
jgi:DNA-binding transcriptional MerR regulator